MELGCGWGQWIASSGQDRRCAGRDKTDGENMGQGEGEGKGQRARGKAVIFK